MASNDEQVDGNPRGAGSAQTTTPARPLATSLNGPEHDSAAAAGRRAGDNGAIRYAATDNGGAARFFGRRSQTNVANYAPYARPRDSSGDSRGRKIVYDYPLPDERLIDSYRRAVEHMATRYPMRAAVLSDMLGRVVSSLERYKELRREEEEKHQNYNEEARRAGNFLDEQIEAIRAEREVELAELDKAVEEAIAARAAARETAAIARAAAGYGIDFATLDSAIDDLVEAAPPPAPLPGSTAPRPAPSGAPVQPVPAPRQVTWKVKAPEPPSRPQVVIEAATFKGGELKPAYVPFPISEAEARARPIEAIAVERGLPIESPAARQMTMASRVFGWCALVASGIIFGISIGLLVKAIDPEMFSIRPERVLAPALVLGLIGVAMFWSLGRIVSLLAALASEERHAGMLASNRLEPDVVGKWLRRTGYITLLSLGLCTIVLVAIEANVERWGIFQVFLQNAANNVIAEGAHAHATGGPGFWTVFCLVLTVSLPFVLFHAAEGWVESRARSIAAHLRAVRASEVWRMATDIHSERVEEVRKAIARAEADEAERIADRKAQAQAQLKAAAAEAEILAEERTAYLRAAAHEAAAREATARGLLESASSPHGASPNGLSRDGVVGGDGLGPLPAVALGATGPVRDTDIALAIERAREASARLREARGRRHATEAEFDARIAALEAQRRPERVEFDQAGMLRVEDAYHDYIGAAIQFDASYRREMSRMERMSRPGVLRGMVDFLFRPGG